MENLQVLKEDIPTMKEIMESLLSMSEKAKVNDEFRKMFFFLLRNPGSYLQSYYNQPDVRYAPEILSDAEKFNISKKDLHAISLVDTQHLLPHFSYYSGSIEDISGVDVSNFVKSKRLSEPADIFSIFTLWRNLNELFSQRKYHFRKKGEDKWIKYNNNSFLIDEVISSTSRIYLIHETTLLDAIYQWSNTFVSKSSFNNVTEFNNLYTNVNNLSAEVLAYLLLSAGFGSNSKFKQSWFFDRYALHLRNFFNISEQVTLTYLKSVMTSTSSFKTYEGFPLNEVSPDYSTDFYDDLKRVNAEELVQWMIDNKINCSPFKIIVLSHLTPLMDNLTALNKLYFVYRFETDLRANAYIKNIDNAESLRNKVEEKRCEYVCSIVKTLIGIWEYCEKYGEYNNWNFIFKDLRGEIS